MNELMKQRLVGALILLALGVIFWPIIFVQPGEEGAVAGQGIPPQPRVSTEPVEAPDRVGLRGSKPLQVDRDSEDIPPQPPGEVILPQEAGAGTTAAPEEAPAEPESAAPPGTRTEPPPAVALDGDGVPVAWVLQVATVSSARKADALRDELIALHEKAYVEEVTSNGRRLYRVYVGPKLERARLDSLQPTVDARFGVKSLVRRYRP